MYCTVGKRCFQMLIVLGKMCAYTLDFWYGEKYCQCVPPNQQSSALVDISSKSSKKCG